jgi:hypothetical protein
MIKSQSRFRAWKEKGADSCNLAREWRGVEKKAQEFFI